MAAERPNLHAAISEARPCANKRRTFVIATLYHFFSFMQRSQFPERAIEREPSTRCDDRPAFVLIDHFFILSHA